MQRRTKQDRLERMACATRGTNPSQRPDRGAGQQAGTHRMGGVDEELDENQLLIKVSYTRLDIGLISDIFPKCTAIHSLLALPSPAVPCASFLVVVPNDNIPIDNSLSKHRTQG